MASRYANAQGYGLGAQAVAYAARFLGVPYVWGGASPAGFDCSGLVQYVYQHFGVTLPRTSQEQARAGAAVGRADLQPGDLIVYNEPGEGPASHVAVYAGGGLQIEAPQPGQTVQYSKVDWAHFAGARRVTGAAVTGAVATGAAAATGAGAAVASFGGWLRKAAVYSPALAGGIALTVWGLARATSPAAAP